MEKTEIKQRIKDIEKEISIYESKQMAIKILLNSGYGAFGSPYFALYDIRLAESITYTAQLVNRWIHKWLKEKLKIDVEYSDTDSIYISIEKQVRKYCDIKNIKYESLSFKKKSEIFDLITEKISEEIKKGYEVLAKNLNVIENRFEMKRELYGDRGIWLGKKNYCIKMIDKEGSPKTKKDKPYVKGYDIAKKAATSPWIIKKLSEYLEFIFYNNSSTELISFEREAYKEYSKLNPYEIFKPKSVSSLNNYNNISDKGIPAHIKGALVYNKILKENNLTNVYPVVYENDKIKYCYVLPDNCLGTHCISVQNTIDIDKFMKFINDKYKIEIDYKKMWETDFIKPVRRLTDAIGIDMKNSNKVSFLSLFNK